MKQVTLPSDWSLDPDFISKALYSLKKQGTGEMISRFVSVRVEMLCASSNTLSEFFPHLAKTKTLWIPSCKIFSLDCKYQPAKQASKQATNWLTKPCLRHQVLLVGSGREDLTFSFVNWDKPVKCGFLVYKMGITCLSYFIELSWTVR